MLLASALIKKFLFWFYANKKLKPILKGISVNKLTVTCPDCGSNFEPADAYRHLVQTEVDVELKKSREKLLEQEKAIKSRQADLELKQKDFDGRVEAELKTKLQAVQEKANKEAKQELSLEMQDLKNQLLEKQKALSTSQTSELELRKAVREVEEKEKNLELEIQRRAQDQVDKEKTSILSGLEQDFNLKLLEKEKQIKDMQSKLEDAKRASLQGSQQNQGEAIEEDIENQLKLKYPTDTFDPVPKGVEGADLIQSVRNSVGEVVGKIVFEVKNTKSYSAEWVQKLSKDQRTLGADAAILVTKTMPKDSPPIFMVDGVFVVSLSIVVPFVSIVRRSIEDLSFARAVTQGQDEKMKLVYSYLTGPAFKQKIMSIVQAFELMKDQHESEKKYFKKMWSAREKMLDQVIDSAAGMYGDIEGIAGRVLPAIEAFDLPAIEADSKAVQ